MCEESKSQILLVIHACDMHEGDVWPHLHRHASKDVGVHRETSLTTKHSSARLAVVLLHTFYIKS